MSIDWEKVQQAIIPIKNYEELCQRLRVSFSYEFVVEKFNLSMAELKDYTHKLLGGDSRGRYGEYLSYLERIIGELQQAGGREMLDLVKKTDTRASLEAFTREEGLEAIEVASLLKYIVYWLIPTEKYLGGLVRDNAQISMAIKLLQVQGIKTNLDMLQRGRTAADRKALEEASKLPVAVITELVNRADFSRLPWASKATISNIIGAGYASLRELAEADPDKLCADFFSYGRSIGKNLRLGNEIENSYRIARIVPAILEY